MSGLTPSQWMDDFCSRLEVNEGVRLSCYRDTMDIPTVGVGFNLQRADAGAALAAIGASLGDVLAGKPLTSDQNRRLLEYSVVPIISQARASLVPTHFDLLSDARRCAIADLVFNVGAEGWRDFHGTRGLIDEAVHTAVRLNDPKSAHALFGDAAEHLRQSLYASQVGDRALRNCEMIESSVYVAPTKTY